MFIFTLISASLLHAYDTSWQVESFPSLIGKSNSATNEEKTSAQSRSVHFKRPFWCLQIYQKKRRFFSNTNCFTDSYIVFHLKMESVIPKIQFLAKK